MKEMSSNNSTLSRNLEENTKKQDEKEQNELNSKSNGSDHENFDEERDKLEAIEPEETSQLQTLTLNDTVNEAPSQLNATNQNNLSNANKSSFRNQPNRTRNESLRQFTSRVRSFSNDVLRSIENAHGMVDLKHSNFSHATQTAAAAAAATHHSNDYLNASTYLSPNYKPKNTVLIERPIDEINIEPFEIEQSNNNNNINTINQTQSSQKRDEVDFRVKKRHAISKSGSKRLIPDDIHISILEVFIYLWGVITFFADLISDIILSIEYFKNSSTWLGLMTLMLVIVPNITLSLFSLSWYIDNYYEEKEKNKEKTSQKKICGSITFWISTIFFVVFQLDLVWKYIQGFVFTLKGWACRSIFNNPEWEKYYIGKQIRCDVDIGMLRLIDVFLDSGPQVLLQLYVITTQNLNKLGSANIVVFTFKDIQTTSLEIKQLVSILSSLFSMAYALAGYHRCLRNQQFIFYLDADKPVLPRPMSWLSTIMQFLWYLFLIAPRVLSMALFASTFRSWFLMIVFTHWIIMFFWILRLKTNYCISSETYNAREEIFEKFYNFVCSFIYIFVYFNLKAGPTFLRYLIYYMIFYSENILFCVSYFFFSKETNFIYKVSMLFIVVVGFWIAISFQIVYYLHCHPSQDISVCVHKKTEFHFIHKEQLKASYMSDSSAESCDENTQTYNNDLIDNLEELNQKSSNFIKNSSIRKSKKLLKHNSTRASSPLNPNNTSLPSTFYPQMPKSSSRRSLHQRTSNQSGETGYKMFPPIIKINDIVELEVESSNVKNENEVNKQIETSDSNRIDKSRASNTLNEQVDVEPNTPNKLKESSL
jgi:hypothetical protein